MVAAQLTHAVRVVLAPDTRCSHYDRPTREDLGVLIQGLHTAACGEPFALSFPLAESRTGHVGDVSGRIVDVLGTESGLAGLFERFDAGALPDAFVSDVTAITPEMVKGHAAFRRVERVSPSELRRRVKAGNAALVALVRELGEAVALHFTALENAGRDDAALKRRTADALEALARLAAEREAADKAR